MPSMALAFSAALRSSCSFGLVLVLGMATGFFLIGRSASVAPAKLGREGLGLRGHPA